VVREEVGLPAALRSALPEAVETLARATVAPGSAYAGRSLVDINLETETGVRAVAIRRADDWIHSPDRDTVLQDGDVVLCRGPETTVDGVYETLTGEDYERPDPDRGPSDIEDLDRAVESVVLMKNMSELAVDLAYGSVLFDSEGLAEEVRELEVEVDALQDRFEAWALRAAGAVDDPVSIRGLMHIGASTEVISDAAVEISEGVLRGLSSHPVVQAAVAESDEILTRAVVGSDSALDGATTADVHRDAGAGVHLLAVRRGGDDAEWVFSPDADTDLRAGDHLIAKGTRAGAERLAALTER